MASCEKKQREMKLVTTLGDLSQVWPTTGAGTTSPILDKRRTSSLRSCKAPGGLWQERGPPNRPYFRSLRRRSASIWHVTSLGSSLPWSSALESTWNPRQSRPRPTQGLANNPVHLYPSKIIHLLGGRINDTASSGGCSLLILPTTPSARRPLNGYLSWHGAPGGAINLASCVARDTRDTRTLCQVCQDRRRSQNNFIEDKPWLSFMFGHHFWDAACYLIGQHCEINQI